MRKQGELLGHAVLRFGPCAIDVSRREVRRQDAIVHLTPNAFDLVALLIGEAARVVPKFELHQRLWLGTFVSDATLGEEGITGTTALRDGDRLQFGTVSALYRASGAGMSTETQGGRGVLPHNADIPPHKDSSHG